MTRRFAVLLLPLAFVVVACTGGDETVSTTLPPQTSPPLPTTPPELTTVAPAPESTEPSVTSTSSSTTPPSVLTSTTVDDAPSTTQPGDPDWVTIVQGLYEQLNDINADPSIDRIGEFCVEVESPCRDVQGAQVEALVRDGWHVLDPVAIPVISAVLNTTVDGLPPETSTLVVLDVVIGDREGSVGTIVDSNGDTVFEVTAESVGDGRITWFIRREADRGWRVFEIG